MFHVEQTKKDFDIIVVGGGHAGLEAAWSSQQFGLDVAIVTMPNVPIASAPCNPAIGGVGKGQVVREIDAMGGLMGFIADKAAIQYRTLNESKGYAVQSTRVQIDKEVYSEVAEKVVKDSSITVVRGRVDRVSRHNEKFELVIDNKHHLSATKVIVTTGTFLKGQMHTGASVSDGGRVGSLQSSGIDDIFSGVKSLPKRFKTGTPPRLKRGTIDFSKMEAQPSDPTSIAFHSLNKPEKRNLTQIECHLTRTNKETLKIIRDNKDQSPIFNGQIKGVGPRYCPSIEDKAYRYIDKDIHHVFVEPEGLGIDSFYPNGVSTSLPKEIQREFIATISGLENAEILVDGYAVEYDVVDTTLLSACLEYQDLPGLYFAGQVCGTSGYEEAAGQGLVAGINAALSLLDREPMVLSRYDSYIGVMVDDLTGNLRDEPYRLFTARSENRLTIREDNSIPRMSKYRKRLGLSLAIDDYSNNYLTQYNLLYSVVGKTVYKSGDSVLATLLANTLTAGQRISLVELLRRSTVDPVHVLSKVLSESGFVFDQRVIRNVAIDVKYAGYVKRSEVEMEKYNKLSAKNIDWATLASDGNLSNECKQRIERIRPGNFGQLQRIEGIRPATVAYVAANCL